MEKEKVILIDGSSYFFRAFYAIPRLSTSKGFPTNAIYGFITMLMKVLEVEKPKYLGIAFDTPKPTFRKKLYPEYKANRQKPPDDLVVQIPEIFKAVDAFQIWRLDKEGFEADDILGTLARRGKEMGLKVEIITGDKDLAQLVDSDVNLYDTMRDKRMDEKGVEEKFQVRPDQIVDLFALMGDSSDNIPGVSGVGEKTATELIKQFGSLEGIYENLDAIKQEKRRETLRAEKEMAFLSQKLARVDSNVPMELELDHLAYRGPDNLKLKEFFEKYEFHGLTKKFNFEEPKKEIKKIDYSRVDTEEALKNLVKKCYEAKEITVDTETTSLNTLDAELVGVSISYAAESGYYIPVGHRTLGAQIDIDTLKKILAPMLADEKVKKIGQNIKYDLQVLKTAGIELRGISSDTMLESFLIDVEGSHGLDGLAKKYLDYDTIKYSDVTGVGKKQISFADVEIDKAVQYAAEDADITYRLHKLFYPKLKENGLLKLHEEIEMPLLEVLSDMEYTGINIDRPKLEKLGADISVETTKIEATIYKLAGETFNIQSPKQLSVILFEKLKLPVVRKTKTGVSTDESVLLELQLEHPICEQILKYRELMKLQSTYVQGLLAEIHPRTQRVHTHYNQTIAATGRLSSTDPNLQNIPTNKVYDIRSVFIASPGHELLSADYSQIELRILAHMSGDKALKQAFEENLDIHSHTASLIFGTKEVTDEQRRIGKTINFGVVYGQTPYGLSQTLGISPKDAKVFIELFYEKYHGVKTLFEKNLEEIRKTGFSVTMLGRRRSMAGINSQNRMVREMTERAAINSPIQGTAADMIKIAMIRVWKKLKSQNLKSQLLLQVHDELVLDVLISEKKQVEKIVREEMENAIPMSVTMSVALGSGQNWSQC